MPQIGPPWDFSKLDAILGRVLETPKLEILVGYPGEAGEHRDARGKKSVSLATLAAIHDLGAPGAGVPERAFVRQSVRNRSDQYSKMLAAELRQAYAGNQSVERAYERVAVVAAGGLQQEITSPRPAFVPLKDKTIARKRSSVPLIDSGQLRQAGTAVVRPKGRTR